MTDRIERLEAELAAMRPRPLPAALGDRIATELAAPVDVNPWPDRLLLSAVASGAIAACVIAAVLLKPTTEPFPAPPAAVAAAPQDPPRAGDYALVIARAEWGP